MFLVLQFKLGEGLALAENSKEQQQCHSNRIPLHLVRLKDLMNENLTFYVSSSGFSILGRGQSRDPVVSKRKWLVCFV